MRIAHFDDHVSPVTAQMSYLHIVPAPSHALLRSTCLLTWHSTITIGYGFNKIRGASRFTRTLLS
uniref:Uncharacterized protein n=1 Tax=Arundo donax TaxID=35708 RepID=A0A0A9H3P4_ARUDO